MSRTQLLLSILAAILIVVAFWLLLFQPQRERLVEVEDLIAVEEDQQAQLRAEIERLRSVRDEAPEVEAELAAFEAIVPRDPALPSALRQLQIAADESGAVLQSVATARPEAVEAAPAGLARINVNVQLLGGYFQIVDFLRRTEDPAVTPRGVSWNNLTITVDEYPTLTVTLVGELYALLPAPPPEPEPEPEEVDPDAPDEDTDDVEDPTDEQEGEL